MWPDLGFFLLFFCCLLSIYGSIASLGAALLRHKRLFYSAKISGTCVTVMAVTASLILWVLFFKRDYSVDYIFKNSSNDLPIGYTITAFWSSLEGSHLLWTLLLTIFSTLSFWTAAKDNEHIMPYVSASLQAVLGWMFYLAVTYSDPFLLRLPIASNGQGMNALLQNPYMSFHPPSLFIGYTALAIPFGYSIAALCYGDITEGWLKSVRRWTLVGWAFLTVGIFLGGRWAYVELGWAGYWAWDPVENSSFIPWLFATALLHSLLVQDKLGHLKRLSLVMAIMAFWFSFFGTFITRSGVISSVHSFALSPIGPNYLAYLAVLLLVCLGLYAWRAPSILPPEADRAWGVSKESALVVTQFLLITFVVIVVIGTLFPIISEALTDQRISIQAPYFNMFSPYLGLGFIVAIALGNVLRYHSGKIPGGAKVIWISMLASLPVSLGFMWIGDVFKTVRPFNFAAQVVGIFLVFWSIFLITYDFYTRLKSIRFKFGMFFGRNLAYTGAYVAHIGLLVAILGFLGNYRGLEKSVTLEKGQTLNLFDYEFKFDGIEIRRNKNVTLFAAPLGYYRPGHQGTITAARSQYPTKPELLHEIGTSSTFWHDLYVVLSDFDKQEGKSATFEIHINPTVRIVWISGILIALGGIIALFDKHRGRRSRDALMNLS